MERRSRNTLIIIIITIKTTHLQAALGKLGQDDTRQGEKWQVVILLAGHPTLLLFVLALVLALMVLALIALTMAVVALV